MLVHGLAASIEQWSAVLPSLAAARRVIAYDLTGFGFASKPDVDYRYPMFCDQLEQILDHQSIERADVLGSSLGASLIVRFSALKPGRLRRAVLADPGGFGRYVHPFLRVPTVPGLGTVMSRPQRATNAFAIKLAVHDRSLRTRQAVDLADELSRMPGNHRAFVRTLRGVTTPFGVRERDSFEQQWTAMNEPSLVVWGKQDKLFPARQLDRARALRPDAAYATLDNCGHFPQVDQPAALAQLTLEHLR